jgi:REP element-mobilizing transposase RayT
VTFTKRRLPHWDASGQPQFITFCLRESLPTHKIFPPAQLSSGEAFLAMDCLLDQARSGPTFLKQPAIAETVWNSLQCGKALGHYEIHSWVIMPNHVHLLLTPRVSLARLLNSMKAASAKHANRLLGRTGQSFWQNESYDHLVRDDNEFRRSRHYIEGNPVKACLVARPEDFAWSSARKAACEAAAGQGPALQTGVQQ